MKPPPCHSREATVIAVAWWKDCMSSCAVTRTSRGQMGPSAASQAESSLIVDSWISSCCIVDWSLQLCSFPGPLRMSECHQRSRNRRAQASFRNIHTPLLIPVESTARRSDTGGGSAGYRSLSSSSSERVLLLAGAGRETVGTVALLVYMWTIESMVRSGSMKNASQSAQSTQSYFSGPSNTFRTAFTFQKNGLCTPSLTFMPASTCGTIWSGLVKRWSE
mmetsp:Transcript_102004/g.304333  ORF Transcript_102004/g.304333 Transcript_102004/m.304333 type:complete len:220 (+) Transcript_102004:177-836(+)